MAVNDAAPASREIWPTGALSPVERRLTTSTASGWLLAQRLGKFAEAQPNPGRLHGPRQDRQIAENDGPARLAHLLGRHGFDHNLRTNPCRITYRNRYNWLCHLVSHGLASLSQ